MKSVLLVDDDNTVLLGIGVRLKSMGYSVYTAKDAVSDAVESALSPGDNWLPRAIGQ
jgi:CheY-like chemotaxis protein